MKKTLYMTVTVTVIAAGATQAQMVIEPGSDDRINWQSLEDLSYSDLGFQVTGSRCPSRC